MLDGVYSWFSRRTLTGKLCLLFSIPVLFLVIGTVISVLNFHALESTVAEARKSDAILSQINTYLKLLYFKQNAAHGYFLSEKHHLLPSLRKSMDDLSEAAHSLVELVSDSPSPVQRERAATIRDITLRHLRDIQTILDKPPGESIRAGAEFLARTHEQGRDFTIASIIDAFDKEAHRIQEHRQSAIKSRRETLLIVTLSGAAIILLSTGLGVMVVIRTVTEPMAALTRVAARIGASGGVSFPAADRPDEVGILSRSMADVDRQIRNHLERLIQSEASMRRLNANLLAAEHRYRSLVEQAPLGIFSTSGVTWTFANRIQKQLMGLPDGAEPSFEQWSRALHPDDRDRVVASFRDAATQGRHFDDSFRLQWQDGTIRHVLSKGVPIDDLPDGPCVLWINLDVTQIEELQQRLAPAERLAAMTRMATSIAHDLRTPLVGLERSLQRLHQTAGHRLKRGERKLLEDIWVGSRLAVGIVQDILDLYQHAYCPLPLSYSHFDLIEMVREVVDLMAAEIEARHLDVRIEGDTCEVSADRRRLARVVLNLLENAVKNSPQEGRVGVMVGGRHEGDMPRVVVAIEDEGSGVDATTLERLSGTDAFPMTPSRRGTGLGLYLCRIITAAHGGTLVAENRQAGGARFTVDIPMAGTAKENYADTTADRRRSALI